jgi:UDP-3-O-[3-hydroxymyristoyl] glucosamine N-acyltransferase
MEKPIRTGRLDTTLGELATRLGGTLDGPGDLAIASLTSAEAGDRGGIAFAESEKYVAAAAESGVAALLLSRQLDAKGLPCIRVDDPRMAFFRLLHETDRPLPLNHGIHPTAIVDHDAIIEEGARVGPYVVVEGGTTIRQGAQIHAGVFIGPNCEIGKEAVLLPHAVLVRNVTVGDRTTVHSSAVLGADGFGYAWDGRRRVKIPQVGSVVLGDDVEIGALTAIDRATSGSTKIGRGTKVDNLVQIAHNVTIGENGAIAALTGIAGSAVVGDRVVLGGQSAVSDHIEVAADVTLGGRGAASSDIPEPGVYLDSPAQEFKVARRNIILRTKLVELLARIRDLEAKVAELEAKNP